MSGTPADGGAVARLTEHKTAYVAWGWAVNGFASVVGAVLSTLLAMSFGFRTVMLVALVIYGIAVLTLWGLLPNRGAAIRSAEPAQG